MIVIPAIDLKEGKCVRLVHGDVAQKTVYSEDPVEMAKMWQMLGAARLHVVDLDGALTGTQSNFEWVVKIKQETNLFVQLGGGIRSLESINRILGAGIDRVILGTIVFEEAGLAQAAFEQYHDRIMVALDVKDDEVMSRGWLKKSGFPLHEALSVVEKLEGKEIIYTDIGRDGTLAGVNIDSVKNVMAQTPLKIFASGGVTSIADIEALKALRSPGCIVGKALYEGKLNLAEALRVSQL